MLNALSTQLLSKLILWSEIAQRKAEVKALHRKDHPILIFFHGYSLAHTIRPLSIADALRNRGYPVEFAGVGPHQALLRERGFRVHAVETMPQDRMDAYVAKGDYAYYDLEWIERCVQAERALIRRHTPSLVIGDMRPTLRLSAALEGVDIALVTQAYNMHNYPFHIDLGQSFSANTGPFDDYLNQRDAIKPHSLIKLVADVPQFHPPAPTMPSGHHYVGPLLAPSPLSEDLPDLANLDWDTNLPLIYLNCGSTGGAVAFLQPLLDELAHRPYRVLVTTAGRCSAMPPANAHIVDFVPAEWAMKQAALYIGIGGIGSIYHALKQGTPIIGAPEHLDQEYHLNRVSALALGHKMDWADFHQPQRILQAIQHVFAHYDQFRKNCLNFSDHVKKWQGNDAVADIIDSHLQAQQEPHCLDSRHQLSEDEFIHQLNLGTPDSLSRQEIRSMLQAGCQKGLPHKKQAGALYFDQNSSWNWLYNHDPKFFACDYLACEKRRQTFFEWDKGKIKPRRYSQRFHLTYTYRIHPQTLEVDEKKQARLFIPYPIATPYQSDIKLLGVSRDDLVDYLCPKMGFFYNYPLRDDFDTCVPIEISYTCEVTVQTRNLARSTSRHMLADNQRRHYTKVDSAIGESGVVRTLRSQLALTPAQSDFERAYQIYRHLVDEKRFKKTHERSSSMHASVNAILTDDGGHCYTMSNAFIALCRLEGIPARRVTGALAGYPSADATFALGSYSRGCWGHTWAEIFIDAYGWIPVEFHSIVIGNNASTPHNLYNDQLRQLISNNDPAYKEYYFGNLDCHRITCSNSVHDMPRFAVATRDPATYGSRLTCPPSFKDECHLKMECR